MYFGGVAIRRRDNDAAVITRGTTTASGEE